MGSREFPIIGGIQAGLYNHLVGVLRRILRHLMGLDEMVIEGVLVPRFYDPLRSRSYSLVRLHVLKGS